MKSVNQSIIKLYLYAPFVQEECSTEREREVTAATPSNSANPPPDGAEWQTPPLLDKCMVPHHNPGESRDPAALQKPDIPTNAVPLKSMYVAAILGPC